MKTSEVFEKLSDLYENWGDFEKCTCPEKMYHASYILCKIANIFWMYEEGLTLDDYYPEENASEDEKLIVNINAYLQHLI